MAKMTGPMAMTQMLVRLTGLISVILGVLLWTGRGIDMTHNPVWIEPFDSAQGRPSATGLRGYFMPEDDKSTLYIYDVDTK